MSHYGSPTKSVTQGKVTFATKNGEKAYAFEHELFKGLNVEESKWTNTGRQVQVS